jgi:hypothetical protein
MRCPHRFLDLPDGLVCRDEAGHEFGHTYEPTTDDLGDHGRHADDTDGDR